jgi:Big-like domain-containing protein
LEPGASFSVTARYSTPKLVPPTKIPAGMAPYKIDFVWTEPDNFSTRRDPVYTQTQAGTAQGTFTLDEAGTWHLRAELYGLRQRRGGVGEGIWEYGTLIAVSDTVPITMGPPSVRFSPDPLYVCKGEVGGLTATVTPTGAGGGLTFDTANSSIATVTGSAASLFVAGVAPGKTQVRAWEGTTQLAAVDVWVVHVDLTIQGLPEQTSPPPNEESPGAAVPLNDDDDNRNSIPDRLEPVPLPGENDLVPAALSLQPSDLPAGTLSLDMFAEGAKVYIWTSPDKASQVAPSTTWRVGTDAIPATLYLEGHQTSGRSGDVEVRLTYAAGDATCTDRAFLTVVETDLEIDGLTDFTEDLPGGLVVRRFDNNNAPRKRIDLYVEPDTWEGDVILENLTQKLKVFTSTGAEITFNGSDNKFSSQALPGPLYVEGFDQSSAMQDAKLRLRTAVAGGGDTINFTVLWVDVVRTFVDGRASEQNSARPYYMSLKKDHSDELEIDYFGGFTQEGELALWIGWGTETRGRVFSGFNHPNCKLYLDRDHEGRFWRDNGVAQVDPPVNFSSSIPPGNDLSPPTLRDDIPDPLIYDIDIPGPRMSEAPQNQIRRARMNFRAFATAEIEGVKIRCSPIHEWFFRLSVKQLAAPSGIDWVVINPPDVPGDNQAGAGQTPLTWNLQ